VLVVPGKSTAILREVIKLINCADVTHSMLYVAKSRASVNASMTLEPSLTPSVAHEEECSTQNSRIQSRQDDKPQIIQVADAKSNQCEK
jgi:hypothetical protein